MKKQGRFLLIALTCACLSSCVGGLWTGASMVYDRHSVYKKINDYQLLVQVTNIMFPDEQFKAKGCSLDIAVFNGDVLVAGHLATQELMDLAFNRLKTAEGYRRLFKEIYLNDAPSNSVQDGWITTKIRSQIFADDSIDPKSFKIITADRIVYLMGDVRPEQGEKVILIARNVSGVVRVVTLLKYYNYQPKKNVA